MQVRTIIILNIIKRAEGGIRTHDDVSNPDYKSGAIDHYATSAFLNIYEAQPRLLPFWGMNSSKYVENPCTRFCIDLS